MISYAACTGYGQVRLDCFGGLSIEEELVLLNKKKAVLLRRQSGLGYTKEELVEAARLDVELESLDEKRGVLLDRLRMEKLEGLGERLGKH